MKFVIEVQPCDEAGLCVECPIRCLLMGARLREQSCDQSPSVENVCLVADSPEKLSAIVQCVEASFKANARGITPVSLSVHTTYVVLFYLFKVFGLVRPSASVCSFVKQLAQIPHCAYHVENNFKKIVRSMQVESVLWKKGPAFVPYEDIAKHFCDDVKKHKDIKERVEALHGLMQDYGLIAKDQAQNPK